MTAVFLVKGDEAVVAALRSGDAQAFAELVDAVGPTMLRLVLTHVATREVAEDVVQEAWIRVLRSIEQFEGRSSLRTWICTIAINLARKRAVHEGRSIAQSSLPGSDDADADGGRYFGSDHPRWAEAWTSAVRDWREIPEERLLSNETRAILAAAIEDLPQAQRAVFLLYDVEGFSGEEICNVLGLTGSNQRVLLHRARTQLRAALAAYVDREV